MAKGEAKALAKATQAMVRQARREQRQERVQERRARRGQVAVPELRGQRLPLRVRRPRLVGVQDPAPAPAAAAAPIASSGNTVDDLLARLQDPNLKPRDRRQLRRLLAAAQRSERIKARERVQTARIEGRRDAALARAEAQQSFQDRQRAKIEQQGGKIESLKEDLELAGAPLDAASLLDAAAAGGPTGAPVSSGPSAAVILGGIAAVVGIAALLRRRKAKGGKK